MSFRNNSVKLDSTIVHTCIYICKSMLRKFKKDIYVLNIVSEITCILFASFFNDHIIQFVIKILDIETIKSSDITNHFLVLTYFLIQIH